ncbi:MAG: enoyl-CoA hydratase/isomerase family protein [Planctomycetaceae bacterium]|nr:enoyl-CoA hydratase/isomerase family protein [Planctomycetaceae bacterium]
MDYQAIIVSKSGAVATITLNRPDKRNALNPQLVDELTAAIKELGADASARVVVLRGNGPAFCAGADLAVLQTLQTAKYKDNLKDGHRLKDMFHAIYSCPKPTIAAVHGPALAGGAGLASVCDFVVAAKEAAFGYTEVRIGFIPAIVMVFLTRQVGERAARDLALSGRILNADEARAMGLVNTIVEAAQLDTTIEQLTKQLLQNSPQAIAMTKELLPKLWDASSGTIDSLLTAAVTANAEARGTDDCKEGVAAFLEKRKPKWVQ